MNEPARSGSHCARVGTGGGSMQRASIQNVRGEHSEGGPPSCHIPDVWHSRAHRFQSLAADGETRDPVHLVDGGGCSKRLSLLPLS